MFLLIYHCLGILVLLFTQFLLEFDYLGIECIDAGCKYSDGTVKTVNRRNLSADAIVYDEYAVEVCLDVAVDGCYLLL